MIEPILLNHDVNVSLPIIYLDKKYRTFTMHDMVSNETIGYISKFKYATGFHFDSITRAKNWLHMHNIRWIPYKIYKRFYMVMDYTIM